MSWAEFEIKGSTGELLAASMLDAGDLAPVAVLCHGIGSKGLNGTNTVVGPLLHEHGITVVTFDLSGHGRSTGSFGETSVLNAARDITDVVGHVQSERPDRATALLGNSFSGCGSILAAKWLKLTCLGLKAPLLDWEHALTVKFGVDAMRAWEASGWAPGLNDQPMNFVSVVASRTVDVFEVFQGLDVPIRVWQGTEDEDIPKDNWTRLRELCDGKNREFIQFDGGNHRLSDADFEPFVANVVEFFVGHLK